MGSVSVIIGILKSRRERAEEESASEKFAMKKSQATIAGFEDGRWMARSQGCRQLLAAGKGEEADCLLEPPEGRQFYWHLDFSPVRPSLHS